MVFPFFDANATDAARFLFGAENPQVIYLPGTISLNALLDDRENEQAFAGLERTIPEGSRNSTMSQIGARIIKRYGDTPEAKNLFLQAAERRKGADGLPEIVPEEAKIVRRIYRELLQGKSTNAIAAMLTEEGIPTPGKKTVWQRATVESILRNEKYKGSALLQKSFTVDFLTKKTKINEGEVPQYYVEDSHPAIIEPWEWEQAQAELERRKNSRTRHRQTSPFSGKIFCADCGEIFGAKTWHSTDRYRRVVWQCNGKFKGERKCETPHLTEEQLKELFLAALGAYLSDRDAAIDQLRCAQRTLTDTDFIDADIQALEEELTGVTGMLRLCIEENAANTTTEGAYRSAHADLCRRFEKTEAKLAALKRQREKMKADAVAIGGMMFELGELDALPLTFDEKLWNGTVDYVTVHADERVVFRFKDGKEITTRL